MIGVFLQFLSEFMELSRVLRNALPDEIRAASESDWDSRLVQRIREDVRTYSRFVSRFALFLELLVFVPLIFVIISLVQHDRHKPFSSGYAWFAAWVVIIWIAATVLFWSVIPIARYLHKLPEAIYRELMQPLWLNLDVLNILINISLLFYIFPSWSNPAVSPIMILLAALWLFAPFGIFVIHRDDLFIRVRLVQFAIVLTLAFVTILSPVPMGHFQTWAQRQTASKLRPVNQEEITGRWAELQWFSQEGASNVWFSFSIDRGYHLYSAPGFDPATNQELQPVLDKATKDLIIASFLAQKAAQERAIQLEREHALAESAAKEKEATLERQRILADSKAQDERAKVELRERLIHDYVSSGVINNAEKRHATALFVLNGQKTPDPILAERLSKCLNDAGLPNDRTVFTPAYPVSTYFRELLDGKSATERLFHPEDFAALVLVIQTSSSFSRTLPVESTEMIAADITWSLKLIEPSAGQTVHSLEIKDRGVGFKESTALKNANARAEAQLVKIAPSLAPTR